MPTDVIQIRLEEGGYYGGLWFDSGGTHVVKDTDRLRRAINDDPEADIVDAFSAATPDGAYDELAVDDLYLGRVPATPTDEDIPPGTTALYFKQGQPATLYQRPRGGGESRVGENSGGESWNPIEVTNAYSASHYDRIFANASGGGFSIELPAVEQQARVLVRKIDQTDNPVTFTTPGSGQIEFGDELTLTTPVSRDLASTGSDYYTI